MQSPTPPVDDKTRLIVAIGDIHGEIRTLDKLLIAIQGEVARRHCDVRLIFLGDLIDRGPASRLVMDTVCLALAHFQGSTLILGNHDWYLRELLRGDLSDREFENWFHQGGRQCIESYTFAEFDTVDELRQLILPSNGHHLNMLNAAVSMVQTTSHCYVHAGINPLRPLNAQVDKELRWIRRGFIDYADKFEKVVVHGHTKTPTRMPEVHTNRIALDTGSYETGRVAAALFIDDKLDGFLVGNRSADTMRYTADLRESPVGV